MCSSSATRSAGRCRWPFRQSFTLLERGRQIEISDSMLFVERSAQASVDATFRRSTVKVSASPSRTLPAAPGQVRFQLFHECFQLGLGGQ